MESGTLSNQLAAGLTISPPAAAEQWIQTVVFMNLKSWTNQLPGKNARDANGNGTLLAKANGDANRPWSFPDSDDEIVKSGPEFQFIAGER